MKCVDAEKFMEEICSHCDSYIEMCDRCFFKDIVNNAAAIDVPDVKHGKWIFVGDADEPQDGGDMCSVCGGFVWDLYTPDCKWCPYCGAKMDGVE